MENILKILSLFGLLIFASIIGALPVMWLWNWLIPAIFGLVKISFFQALGLNLLTGLLFRNIN